MAHQINYFNYLHLIKQLSIMKKFYTLFSFVIIAVMHLSAQSDYDYYIDFNRTHEKIYFKYADGKYTADVNKIEGDFKIYNSHYIPGGADQDKYIFGSADGQGGITPNSEKKLSNPGNNLSIEGGGILYSVIFVFDPEAMTLKIEGGGTFPNHTTLEMHIVSSTGTSPETGELTVSLELVKTGTTSAPDEYYVTAYYTDNTGNSSQQEIVIGNDSMKGTFTFTDLKPDNYNLMALKATATVNGKEISDTGIAPVKTPAMPILIGQIDGHNWEANYGIQGMQFKEIPDGKTYYYTAKLTGDGEFCFVTKLGNSADDWITVDSNIRYAPPTLRVAAPEKTWMPYSEISSGSTPNAWYPENFTPGTYVIEFDYTTKSIAVVKGDIPTDAPSVTIGNDTPAVTDVYSITGVLLRKDMPYRSATEGLPAGLYIVGGKKTVINN